MNVMELRGQGVICFEKKGMLWVHISTDCLFKAWVAQLGFKSMKEFPLEKADVFGTTVGYGVPDESVTDLRLNQDEEVVFACSQSWWNELGLEQLEAVMNSNVLKRSYSSTFTSSKTELDFAVYIMDQFTKVSGWAVQDFLGRIFMKRLWHPKLDTERFFREVSQALIEEFGIVYQKSSDIKYFF